MEIDYFFEFTNEATALADSTISLASQLFARQNIWGFDVGFSIPVNIAQTPPPRPPATEPTPYWCMVAQFAFNSAFQSHPNLEFYLILPDTVLYQNMGNGQFRALPQVRAVYAKNWSFGLPGAVLIDSLGNAMIDGLGNALVQ